MNIFSRWRKRPTPKGRDDPYKRVKEREREVVNENIQLSSEEMVAELNYEPEAEGEGEGQVVRSAWGITAAITGVLAIIAVAGMLIFVGTRASRAWQARQTAPLQQAAATGDVTAIDDLLEKGRDPNAAGADGETPLVAALRTGQTAAARALLAGGAEPTQEAIDAALRYDRREALLDMIRAGADPDTRNTWSTKSLLQLAAEAEDAQAVEVLLEHGANPTQAPNPTPFTTPPIHVAVRQGNLDIARLLLEHGCDPMLRYQGWAAVEMAHHLGHTEIEEMMMDVLRERQP